MPGESRRLHWSFPDPAAVAGDGDVRLSAFRRTRDAIEARITEWLATESPRVGRAV